MFCSFAQNHKAFRVDVIHRVLREQPKKMQARNYDT